MEAAANTAHPPNPNSAAHGQHNAAKLLQSAREAAGEERGYNSTEFRQELVKTFSEAFGGRSPYGWQVDVAEAVWLGLDTAVIAGTGAGKTMPFVMPLLADKTKKKMVIIISPLNELEQDQARRFRQLGLDAAAVNGEVYTTTLHKELLARAFRVIVTSPEMCLEHAQFSQLIKSPDFMRHVLYLVVDEAHCISQWGASFRKKFAELATMRSFIGVRKPFLLTSATLPPFMLADVFLKLEFSTATTYFVNLGNNRPNITPIVHRLKGAESSLSIINFLVRDAAPGSLLPRAIVFFNTRDLTFMAYRYLQGCVSEDLAPQINFLHAGRGQRARRRVMRDFRDGQVNILCATEAAGMGMDIPDITYAIQFLAASSLSVWTQRAGRAGRSGEPAFAILLIEPGIFQPKQSSTSSVEKTTGGGNGSGQDGGKGRKGRGKGGTKGVSAKSGDNGRGGAQATAKNSAQATRKGRAAKDCDATMKNHGGVQVPTGGAVSRRVKEELLEDTLTLQPAEDVGAPSDATQRQLPASAADTEHIRVEPTHHHAPGDSDGVSNSTTYVSHPAPPVEYKKKSEDGMRTWAETPMCRRVVADEYFNNPPRRDVGSDGHPCCDNCIKAKHGRGEPLSERETRVMQIIDSIAGMVDLGHESKDAEFQDDDTQPEAAIDTQATAVQDVPDIKPIIDAGRTGRAIANRRDDHLLACRTRLARWRLECWQRLYSSCAFSHLILLPDKVLTQLAAHARLQTVDDVLAALPQWAFAADHAAEVLEILFEVDREHYAAKEARQRQAKEERARQSAVNKEKRDEDRRLKRQTETAERNEAKRRAVATSAVPASATGFDFRMYQHPGFAPPVPTMYYPIALHWQMPQTPSDSQATGPS